MARNSTTSSSFTFSININEKDLARATKTLDQFQGMPLKQLMLKVEKAAIGLYVNPLKRRAARHNQTGATQASIKVKILKTTRKEIAAFKVGPNTWYRHFAIGGTSQGVRADPYVDDVRGALEPQVFGFIDDQIKRLT